MSGDKHVHGRSLNPATKHAARIINTTAEINHELLRNGGEATRSVHNWMRHNHVAPMVTSVWQRLFRTKDAKLINDAATAKEFWKKVLGVVGIKTFIDPKGLAKQLARIGPKKQPASTWVYREVRRKLTRIAKLGKKGSWATTKGMANMEFPTEETLEALRVYGCANRGFGVMPQKIIDLLGKTGLAWMCANLNERNVPTYWRIFFLELQKKKKSTAYKTLKNTLEKMTFLDMEDDMMSGALPGKQREPDDIMSGVLPGKQRVPDASNGRSKKYHVEGCFEVQALDGEPPSPGEPPDTSETSSSSESSSDYETSSCSESSSSDGEDIQTRQPRVDKRTGKSPAELDIEIRWNKLLKTNIHSKANNLFEQSPTESSTEHNPPSVSNRPGRKTGVKVKTKKRRWS